MLNFACHAGRAAALLLGITAWFVAAKDDATSGGYHFYFEADEEAACSIEVFGESDDWQALPTVQLVAGTPLRVTPSAGDSMYRISCKTKNDAIFKREILRGSNGQRFYIPLREESDDISNRDPMLDIARRFRSHGPGTVVDGEGNLVWTASTQGQGTWQEAMEKCASLDTSKGVWRLPTKVELGSLVPHLKSGRRCGGSECNLPKEFHSISKPIWSSISEDDKRIVILEASSRGAWRSVPREATIPSILCVRRNTNNSDTPETVKRALPMCKRRGGDFTELPVDENYSGGISDKGGGVTPAKAPGATTVRPGTAACVLEEVGSELVVLAPFRDPIGIAGAWSVPLAGMPRPLTKEEDAELLQVFETLTSGRKDRPFLVYCHHVQCFLSYNALVRLNAAGYTNLLWLREGISGWRKTSLPMGLTKKAPD